MDIEEVLTELLGDRRTGDLEQDVVLALLGDRCTGDIDQDLALAGKEIDIIRERNTLLGGFVIEGLRNRGNSYRDIQRKTGIPKSRAARWALPSDS